MTRKPIGWAMTLLAFVSLTNIAFFIDLGFYPALLDRMRSTHVNYLNRLMTAEAIATVILVISIRLVYNRYLTGRDLAGL